MKQVQHPCDVFLLASLTPTIPISLIDHTKFLINSITQPRISQCIHDVHIKEAVFAAYDRLHDNMTSVLAEDFTKSKL